MSKDITIFGSVYQAGLDVLGAGVGNQAPTVSRNVAAGNRAVKAGKRLGKTRPRTGKKLAAMGAKSVAKANAAAKAAKAAVAEAAKAAAAAPAPPARSATTFVVPPVVVPARFATMMDQPVTPPPARSATTMATPAAAPARSATTLATPSAPSPAVRQAAASVAQSVARTATTPTAKAAAKRVARILGEGTMTTREGAIATEVQLMMDFSGAIDALASAGEMVVTLDPMVEEVKKANPTLAREGKRIADAGQRIIDSYVTEDGETTLWSDPDPSVAGQVEPVLADGVAWQAQADAVLTGAPAADASDTGGGSGGGGGGGGGDDSGAPDGGAGDGGGEPGDDETPSSSEEVKKFRESGGEYDPFAEDTTTDEDPFADADSDADSESMDDATTAEAGGLEEETLEGLEAKDYHFQWQDLLMPHAALQRTMKEKQDKEQAQADAFQASLDAHYAAVKAQPAASPTLNTIQRKRLALAQRRLDAQLQRQRELQAAQSVPDTTDQGDMAVMGADDLFSEIDDLILESYERQITDEPGDPMRGRGSAHRGAGYLMPDYPPGGSSSSTEEDIVGRNDISVYGDIEEIFGNVGDIRIFGGGCYSRGLDVLGLGVPSRKVPPRAGFVLKTTPRGRKYTALVVNKPKHGDYKASAQNARNAGKRAVSVGNKVIDVLKRAKTVKTAVHGVATARVRPHSATRADVRAAHKKLSPSQMKHIAEDVIKSGKSLITQGDKLDKHVGVTDSKVKSAILAVQAKMFPMKAARTLSTILQPGAAASRAGRTMAAAVPTASVLRHSVAARQAAVLGALSEMYSEQLDEIHDEVLGQAIVDQATNDATPEASDSGSATRVPGPDSNYGMGPAPTKAPAPVPGLDFTPDPGAANDQAIYNFSTGVAPLGIVWFDDSRGLPRDKAGSWHRYYGPGAKIANGGSGMWWDGSNAWMDRVKENEMKADYHDNTVNSQLLAQIVSNAPEMNAWTERMLPLVGAPGDWTEGMRFDQSSGGWFWYRDKAPAWLTAADDLLRLQQAQVDYAADLTIAKTNFADQELQDQLDADEAAALVKSQTKEDAATQRTMDQEQKTAEHQASVQAVADEQAARKQATEDTHLQEMAEREAQAQATLDERAMRDAEEREAREDERLLTLAQKLDAMEPPPAEAPPDGDAEAENYELEESPLPPEEVDDQSVDDVLGYTYPRVRTIDRIRARRADR